MPDATCGTCGRSLTDPIDQSDRPYTVAEVAHLLRCSQSTVRELLNRGEIRGKRFGSKVWIRRQDVADWLADSNASKATQPVRRSA